MFWPFANQERDQGADGSRSDPPGTPQSAAPERPRHARWNFEAGTEIAEGRTILKRLGGGSAYEVFLVWDERLFALMVAKLLRPDRVGEERALREMGREAALLERLAHPALVRGFGSVTDGAHPHVLLQLVEGLSLGSLIRRQGALPLQQLLPIALHVAAVIHYLAREQVVHLDIKPGNIVMATTPCLIDLSVARSFEQAAQLRGGIGTHGYMAPEQCDPRSSPAPLGPAADVWGLGATLYHATTGRQPFDRPDDVDSSDSKAKYTQLSDSPAPLPRHVPSALKELILDMLHKDPRERPAAEDVAVALKSLVEQMTGRTRKRVRRKNQRLKLVE